MDKNLQNIEDLFKKGLEENEEAPGPNVWDRIDKMLDKDNVASISKKYSYLKIAVILLIFFSSGLGFYIWHNLHNSDTETKNITKSNSAPKSKNKNNVFSHKSNSINLKSSVDSLNLKANNNNSIVGNNDKTVDNNIFNQNKKSLKTIKSVIPNHLSNSSTLLASKKSLKTTESLISNNPNFSISKLQKLLESNRNYKIKMKSVVKEQDAEELTGIEFKEFLPSLKQLIATITKIKSDATNWIDITDAIVLNKKINDYKNIFAKVPTQVWKESRFSIEAVYSPDISFYHFQNNQTGNQNANSSNIEKSETKTYSSTFGALIDYKLHPHWSLQSGVLISTTNINIEPETIYANQDNNGEIKYQINTSSGSAYILPSFSKNPNVGDSIYSMSTTHTLQYLSIPLAIKYNIHKGRITMNAMTGLSANILTQGKISTEVKKGNDNEFETINNIQGLKTFYVSGLAGIGLDYNIYKNISVCFSPTLRFALNSINKDVQVKSFPNSFGFSFGLKLRL